MSSSISSRRSGRLTPYGHTPRKNRREASETNVYGGRIASHTYFIATGSEGQTSDSPFPGHTSGERNVALKSEFVLASLQTLVTAFPRTGGKDMSHLHCVSSLEVSFYSWSIEVLLRSADSPS